VCEGLQARWGRLAGLCMLNSKSFLAVDFGAVNLKIAEFEINDAGGLLLKQYGLKSLGQDGTQESTREAAMTRALNELLSERPFGSKVINLCAPGFHTFSKFVKLPPVDTSKVTQIIQYEAQQNVPFPLEEVVWDYQILGAAASGELEVLLVAIKSDIVEGLFRVAETVGLRLQLVDVSPAALCNSFRYNYGDLEGCTMLLDIGAKTSNLLFFEKGTVYSRGINIGANSITQDFSKESRLSFAEAEKIKIEEGFVSLGGAYEEPENQHQAAISKIARQVMTRLHIQVNQTVQFYRGQQGGSAPQQLYLSGGAAIMPYTAQFFSEKLNVPVEYFNPFRNVQIDPSLNLEELAKVAHSLGEVVGLGLRNLAHCPVELNLMPKSSLKRQQFNQKKPYLIAAVFCLILVVFTYGWFYGQVASRKQGALENLVARAKPLKDHEQTLNKRLIPEIKNVDAELDQFTGWVEDRYYWANIFSQLRQSLLAVEESQKAALKDETGIWIEKLVPMTPAGPVFTANAFNPEVARQLGSPTAAPTTLRTGRKGGAAAAQAAAAQAAGQPGAGASATEITGVILTCRSKNMTSVRASANGEVAYALEAQIKGATNYFEPTNTVLGAVTSDPADLTFSFEITVKLKRPLKL
jgi:type IV pilus assembly protein PilM